MSDPFRLSAGKIAELQDRSTVLWHQNPEASLPPEHPVYQAVLAQHRANFDLWHTEDAARIPGATDSDLAQTKRSIDRINQLRNDLAEQCDVVLLDTLAPSGLPAPAAPLHSESPGLMIDRLSILALKIYHTQEEIARPEAPAGHRERNRDRLSLLIDQRSDLVACLGQLWTEVLAGTRRFKIYRQLKMYNDPTLNPAIYGATTSEL